MPALKKYTYAEAGALLGGGEPLSIRTIERMVEAGDLERIGERMRRRISERSIEAYEQGERGKWGEKSKTTTAAESQAPAMLPKRPMVRGQGTTQSNRVDTTSSAGSIPARLPKRGVIRSSHGN